VRFFLVRFFDWAGNPEKMNAQAAADTKYRLGMFLKNKK
jgi:hypothetical protein